MQTEKKVINSISAACAAALVLIAALALASFWILRTQIRRHSEYAGMLSLCAQQRVQTQRAALLGYSLVNAHDVNLRARLRDQLAELRKNIETTQDELRLGGRDGASEPITELMFEPPTNLDAHMRRFMDEMAVLVSEQPHLLNLDNAHLYHIATASTDLLPKLELLTEAYRHEGEEGFLELEQYHQLVLAATLLLVLGTALFLFWPMIRRLRRELHMRAEVTEELQRSSMALERRTAELARSNAELEHFAGVVAHDLRAPLNNIVAGIAILKQRLGAQGGDLVRELLENSESVARRMGELIAALLQYARAGQIPSPAEAVNLNEVVHEVLADLSLSIKDAKAEVTQAELPVLHGDRVQMRQLFQNLILNAIKYHHPDRTPLVRLYSQQVTVEGDTHYQITVEDNGIGFNSADSEKLFQMFGQLHPENKNGFGIGLATCAKIARQHGGKICAEGAVGEGSKFIVTLPAPWAPSEKEFEAEAA